MAYINDFQILIEPTSNPIKGNREKKQKEGSIVK